MRKFITEIAPAATLSEITSDINKATDTLNAYKVNLTNEEKLGSRSMGTNREGYVRLVSSVASQFPDSLSRTDEPRQLADLLTYNGNLRGVVMAALQLIETVEETLLGADMDIMKLADRYVENLQISRKNEGSLDLAMQQIDAYNKRFANKFDDENPIVPEN